MDAIAGKKWGIVTGDGLAASNIVGELPEGSRKMSSPETKRNKPCKMIRSLKTRLRRKGRKGGEMASSPEQAPSESTQLLAVPASPPPSYEHAVAEDHNTHKSGEMASGAEQAHSESRQLMAVPASPPPSYEHAVTKVVWEVLSKSHHYNEGLKTVLSQQDICPGQSRLENGGEGEDASGGGREAAGGGEESKPPPKEILIVHKSSKELYKALAAQWGITCKMSDHCRCYDCQSHYFDCEYDRDNDQEKTDGGLGAGTPMFISEVMHGTACSIL